MKRKKNQENSEIIRILKFLKILQKIYISDLKLPHIFHSVIYVTFLQVLGSVKYLMDSKFGLKFRRYFMMIKETVFLYKVKFLGFKKHNERFSQKRTNLLKNIVIVVSLEIKKLKILCFLRINKQSF